MELGDKPNHCSVLAGVQSSTPCRHVSSVSRHTVGCPDDDIKWSDEGDTLEGGITSLKCVELMLINTHLHILIDPETITQFLFCCCRYFNGIRWDNL